MKIDVLYVYYNIHTLYGRLMQTYDCCYQLLLILFTGHNKLNLKDLNKVMRHEARGVATRWFDLGVELLDGDTAVLDVIETKYHNDDDRCSRMFKKWLEMKPDTSWGQLVTALNNIGLNAVADNVKDSEISCKGLDIIHFDHYIIFSEPYYHHEPQLGFILLGIIKIWVFWPKYHLKIIFLAVLVRHKPKCVFRVAINICDWICENLTQSHKPKFTV